jgi:hypothetical protein
LSLITWAWPSLLGFLLLFPLGGAYFFFDGRIVHNWRSRLLKGWVKGELDIVALRQAVSAIPALPGDTLQSMIATLPSAENLIAEQGISPGTRSAVAAVVTTIHACRTDAIAVRGACSVLVGASMVLAVLLWTWRPLLGMVLLLSLVALRKPLRQWRLVFLRERLAGARLQPDFNAEKYLELAAGMDWEPISAAEKDKLLATIRPKG